MGIKLKITRWPYAWHRWFAWYPVEVKSTIIGNLHLSNTAWWITIERKRVGGWMGSWWEYREVSNGL